MSHADVKRYGTRKDIVDRKLDDEGFIVRVLACGHTQRESRGGKAKSEKRANCKQCAVNYDLSKYLRAFRPQPPWTVEES